MTKNVVIDTNVIVRYVLNDDAKQNAIATAYLDNAQIRCIVSLHVLCEVDWVLRKKVKIKRDDVIEFLEKLQAKTNVIIDKTLFEIGMYFLKNGGDFADGVIAYQTTQYPNSSLLTFDKDAQKIAKKLNIPLQEP